MAKHKVDAMSLSLALSIPWSVGVFITGLLSNAVPTWGVAVNWLSQFYVGYSSTFLGSLIGGVLGFLDVFIGVYATAWLYNYFHGRK